MTNLALTSRRPRGAGSVLWLYATYIGFSWVYRYGLPALGVALTDRLTGYVNVVVTAVYLLLALWLRPRGEAAPARTSLARSALWAVGGFLLILVGQVLASLVERAIWGAPPGDDGLAAIIRAVPLVAVAMVIAGPLLEEFVFREALFGLLRSRWGVWAGAVVSAFIFAAIHQEVRGLLARVVIGVVLAWVYHRTGRLSAAWLAHALNNLLALVATLLLA